jgi:Carboxypeptidase regulatory-like domain
MPHQTPPGGKRDGCRVIIVNSGEKGGRRKSVVRCVWSLAAGPGVFLWVSLGVLACGFPAQSQQSPGVEGAPTAASGTAAPGGQQAPGQRLPGSLSGIVADQSGSGVAGARVSLVRDDQSPSQETQTDDNGRFSFASVAPGPFQLTITKPGFTTQSVFGILQSGETHTVPRSVLAVAPVVTAIKVTPSRAEMAKYQIEEEEKQRVLGFIPNFFVTYDHNAVPLNSKQKFELAWKTTVDPATFFLTGATAGIEQAHNSFSGYGQGAQGYAKRYGASYADFVAGTFIGGAILPSLLKQDPRYFYKGTGSRRARFLYAIANAVICKGDNGRWQPNYSNVLGDLAAGGISNLYYAPKNRNGAALTFENGLIGIGTTAAANLIQEFLIPKLTPHLPGRQSAKP